MTDKRLTLVTGASRGIGRAVAFELATKHDHHVIALARSKKALEALDDDIKTAGGQATLVPLDLTDAASIERLSAVVLERWQKLDGLVANAGVLGPLGPIHTLKPTEFNSTFDTNLTANWRLIRSFDPLLRMSGTGRAVFMTSGVVPRPRAFWGAYQASKAALEAMVAAWAAETKTTDMKINLFDPGATRTDMRADAMPGEDPLSLPSAEDVAAKLAPLVTANVSSHGERIAFREM
ncbi:SDR family NAD(P)-dependent oxidoreductase [Ponticaulis sp.]|uniref:SDR family NAD(P)-dependent oxidoreductase n=1 Tax=Ponticaulis sp. TaxID=2020902 RepID=UPI000B708723|nr:SDR family NAD(P)-dependent oxidoreductase [Ponticaulis sp.]MAI91940.1 oxidoreductase [Ponticaulis sp.]OUX96414.1 MAG: oxidoreductase [Hyphomonadaceae bacterium TMED5]|tara:strand:- start:16944 stop:17651 length:708 start_codon:yes stop_codon:yes gene_type:complete